MAMPNTRRPWVDVVQCRNVLRHIHWVQQRKQEHRALDWHGPRLGSKPGDDGIWLGPDSGVGHPMVSHGNPRVPHGGCRPGHFDGFVDNLIRRTIRGTPKWRQVKTDLHG